MNRGLVSQVSIQYTSLPKHKDKDEIIHVKLFIEN